MSLRWWRRLKDKLRSSKSAFIPGDYQDPNTFRTPAPGSQEKYVPSSVDLAKLTHNFYYHERETRRKYPETVIVKELFLPKPSSKLFKEEANASLTDKMPAELVLKDDQGRIIDNRQDWAIRYVDVTKCDLQLAGVRYNYQISEDQPNLEPYEYFPVTNFR